MKRIAFVTTSKGRLHHIKETVPLMVAQGVAEVIVVDYGCPDKTGDWVEANFPSVKVVRVTDDPVFCVARARNLGAEQSTSDWLVFIDGDVKAAPGWSDWMQRHLSPGRFYRAAPVAGQRDPETWGTVICMRMNFLAIGGYDEAYRGWGGEDTDLYDTFNSHGIIEDVYPAEFVSAIPHGDEQRVGWSGLQNQNQQMTLNLCYMAAKVQYAKLTGDRGALPLEARTRLMDTTRQALGKWFGAGAKSTLSINYVLRRSPPLWLPRPFAMRTELVFKIRVGPLAALRQPMRVQEKVG